MKFNPDDLIKLALANPGFGYVRFLRMLDSGRTNSGKARYRGRVLRLFEIHKLETGIDAYDVLQDNSSHRLVTRGEWKEITGGIFYPSGYGSMGGRTPKPKRKQNREDVRQVMIPLPPQEFDWLDVPKTGSVGYKSGQGQTNHMALKDVRRILNLLDVEMRTEDQVIEELGLSKSWLNSFLEKCKKYEEEDVLEDWIRVLDLMYQVRTHRGLTHQKDELMADFRGIFRDYVNDPIEQEAPSTEDVQWVYNKLLREEHELKSRSEGEE
jgi:hypothetical protein